MRFVITKKVEEKAWPALQKYVVHYCNFHQRKTQLRLSLKIWILIETGMIMRVGFASLVSSSNTRMLCNLLLYLDATYTQWERWNSLCYRGYRRLLPCADRDWNCDVSLLALPRTYAENRRPSEKRYYFYVWLWCVWMVQLAQRNWEGIHRPDAKFLAK